MELQQIIDASKRIVFFGGAGVSTASGIPDFRSAGGLYAQAGEALNPELTKAGNRPETARCVNGRNGRGNR